VPEILGPIKIFGKEDLISGAGLKNATANWSKIDGT
jgi:hypothetical protein